MSFPKSEPRRAQKVIVLGLDCATPQLIFGTLADAMPFVTNLRTRGVWGKLRSVVPPITVPAWACMTSGQTPGELGIYGFRERKDRHVELSLISAEDIHAPRLWDVCEDAGLRTANLFVPPSYPIDPRARGVSFSCFLTPTADHPHTFPATLGAECCERFGPYRMDVRATRTGDPESLWEEISAMTDQHFSISRHVLTAYDPELLFFVEIGVDRFQHAFFHHLDPAHPDHDPAHPFVSKCREYFRRIDRHIQEIAEWAGPDAALLIVSDHGARPLEGGVRINQWLIDHGYLVLKHVPDHAAPLRPEWVDWSRTRAWGEGGYHARIFIHDQDAFSDGIVAPSERSALLEAIERGLSEMRDEQGKILGNVVVRPHAFFDPARGRPADLFVFFGDLAYRAIGTVGGTGLFTRGDDRGFDACNHDWNGIFIAAGMGVTARGERADLSLHDVSVSAMKLLGVSPPSGWRGRDVTSE